MTKKCLIAIGITVLLRAPVAMGSGLDIVEWVTAPVSDDFTDDQPPVLLDFFATWCLPCRSALPSMVELHAKFGDKVRFITIAADERMSMEDFLATQCVPGAIALDSDGQVAARFGVIGIPWLVYLDSAGSVRWQGAVVTEAILQDLLLGKTPLVNGQTRDSFSTTHSDRVRFSLTISDAGGQSLYESTNIADGYYEIHYGAADLLELIARLTGQSKGRIRILDATPQTRFDVRVTVPTSEGIARAKKRSAHTLAATLGMEIVETDEMVEGYVVRFGEKSEGKLALSLSEGHMSRKPGLVVASGVDMDTIIRHCESAFGMVLFNETGASGVYDMRIEAHDPRTFMDVMMNSYGLEVRPATRKAVVLLVRPVE